MPVRPQLGSVRKGAQGPRRPLRRLAVPVDEPHPAQLQVRDIAFFQVDEAIGHAGQSQCIRGQEVLIDAHADHQRAARASPDHAVRLLAAEHGDRIRALQLPHGRLHRLEQIALVEVVDQVRDDLGIVWLSNVYPLARSSSRRLS